MRSRRDDEGVSSGHIEEEATQRSFNFELSQGEGDQDIFYSGVVAPRLCIPEDTLHSSCLSRRKNLSGQWFAGIAQGVYAGL